MRGKDVRHVPERTIWRVRPSEELADQAISTYLVKGYRMSEDPDRRVRFYKG
jgi:hypothetical protein